MKRLLAALGLVMALAMPVAAGPVAYANSVDDAKEAVCGGVGSVSGGGGCESGTSDLNNFARTIINIFSAVVGIVAVGMIIYAGFRYVTSGGDTSKIGTAKTTLIYAIVGLIVVGLSQTIVRYVLSQVL